MSEDLSKLSQFNWEEDTWDTINSYFRDIKYYITRHQLDSYNDFIINKIAYKLMNDRISTLVKKFSN